jgi:hypothetical protein
MNAARAMVGEMPLHWDPIAAQVALTYADECNYAHNPQAGAEYDALGGSGGLGENIAAGAPSQTVSSAVSSWLAEQTSYDHATNQCAAGKVCGHYTQIVWSTTTGVGCAAASCTTNSPFGTIREWPLGLRGVRFQPARQRQRHTTLLRSRLRFEGVLAAGGVAGPWD